MAANQKELKTNLDKNQKEVINLLTRLKPQLSMALPSHMTADRMVRIALTEYRKIPKLMECDPMTVAASVMITGQLGLEIGVLGQAYLVPYYNNKKGILECQFILGYRGMIDLARRSGQIISISAHTVYAGDEFSFQYGLNEDLKHIPTMGEKKELIAVYTVAKLVGGGYQFEVLSKKEIDAIRKSSKSSEAGPWVTHYDEMAKKTAIRRMFKYLPVSIEMQKAISYEEKMESTDTSAFDLLKEDFDVVIDDNSKEDETPKNQAEALADKLKAKEAKKEAVDPETGEVLPEHLQ